MRECRQICTWCDLSKTSVTPPQHMKYKPHFVTKLNFHDKTLDLQHQEPQTLPEAISSKLTVLLNALVTKIIEYITFSRWIMRELIQSESVTQLNQHNPQIAQHPPLLLCSKTHWPDGFFLQCLHSCMQSLIRVSNFPFTPVISCNGLIWDLEVFSLYQ